MKRAPAVAILVAWSLSAAVPARASTARDTYDIYALHARWSFIAATAGGSENTTTTADVNRYNEQAWIDLSARVERCDAGGCAVVRRASGFAFGTPDEIVVAGGMRSITFTSDVLIDWTDADGLPLAQAIAPVRIVWNPAGRLERTTVVTPLAPCGESRSRRYEGPALATGSIATDPLGQSLEATVSLDHTTHTYRGC